MTQHEIEAKFECTPDASERLVSLSQLGGYALISDMEHTQKDVYFDTTDRFLRARSASLRLRFIDFSVLATYKGPRELIGGENAGIVKRSEIEHPVVVLAGTNVETDPFTGLLARTPALEAAEEAFGPLDLAPVARLTTIRRLREFGDDGSPALELALDQVEGVRLSDGRRVEFFEVELESLTGDVAVLQGAVAELRDAAPGLQPSESTKLGRVLD